MIDLKPLPSAHKVENRKEWLTARARVLSATLRLTLLEIDEIGIALKNDWVRVDEAAEDLAALERHFPIYAECFSRIDG